MIILCLMYLHCIHSLAWITNDVESFSFAMLVCIMNTEVIANHYWIVT